MVNIDSQVSCYLKYSKRFVRQNLRINPSLGARNFKRETELWEVLLFMSFSIFYSRWFITALMAIYMSVVFDRLLKYLLIMRNSDPTDQNVKPTNAVFEVLY